jgi:hypothetical protein
MGPTPDEVLEDLADVLDLDPLKLRRALAPLEGPEVLLRADADVAAAHLPPSARKRLAALVRLFPVWSAAQPRPRALRGPEDVTEHMGRHAAGLSYESFWVIGLDVRGRPLGTFEVARGTLTACLVHPREVFAPMMALRAASVILVHNHPSGDPKPSREDVELTKRMRDAGELVGFPILDHVIIAAGGFRSMLDAGYIEITAAAAAEPPADGVPVADEGSARRLESTAGAEVGPHVSGAGASARPA